MIAFRSSFLHPPSLFSRLPPTPPPQQYATATPLSGFQVNPSLEALLPAGNGGVVSEIDIFLSVRSAFGAHKEAIAEV